VTGRWVLAGLAVLGAACDLPRTGPVRPLADIGRCSDQAVARVPRPGGPRTPPPASWVPGCNPFRAFRLPDSTSRPAVPESVPRFRAGFGKVDITPAPGLGTLGWGPEADTGMGYRNRLKARAMVLQDSAGEVMAFAVVDLDAVSAVLQREAAARISGRTNGAIGADRLILSATHTHSAPGGFLGSWPLNLIGSPVSGFDTGFVRGVAERVAVAVDTAYRRMRRSRAARAAWAVENVWGRTRNRMLDAHRRNPAFLSGLVPPPAAPWSLSDSGKAVNPRWAMLRVEVQEGSDTTWRLAGTYSVFSMHGTMVPAGNDLYDSDIQGAVTRGLEDLALSGDSLRPAIHILANGTEGDVSPVWTRYSRCPLPSMGVNPRAQGPRTPPTMFDWVSRTPEQNAECVAQALAELEALRDSLVHDALRIYRRDTLFADRISIRRNFETVRLTDTAQGIRLCVPAQAGKALAAGGHDGPTRLKGWKAFYVISLGIDWGTSDTLRTDDCQDPKGVLLPFLQTGSLADLQFPEYTHFAVVQVGDVWLGAVPAEATTVAGRQMVAALKRGAGRDSSDRTVIIGLANGYLNYVTTWHEYQAQTYEGGSTLYGPRSAEFMAGRLEALAAGMATPGSNPVDRIVVRPGPIRKTGLRAGAPVPFDSSSATISCAGTGVVVQWNDAAPGLFAPADGPMVRFTTGPATGPGTAIEDDHVRVEVRVVDRGSRTWRWEARWRPATPLTPGHAVQVEFPRWTGARTGCAIP